MKGEELKADHGSSGLINIERGALELVVEINIIVSKLFLHYSYFILLPLPPGVRYR